LWVKTHEIHACGKAPPKNGGTFPLFHRLYWVISLKRNKGRSKKMA